MGFSYFSKRSVANILLHPPSSVLRLLVPISKCPAVGPVHKRLVWVWAAVYRRNRRPMVAGKTPVSLQGQLILRKTRPLNAPTNQIQLELEALLLDGDLAVSQATSS